MFKERVATWVRKQRGTVPLWALVALVDELSGKVGPFQSKYEVQAAIDRALLTLEEGVKAVTKDSYKPLEEPLRCGHCLCALSLVGVINTGDSEIRCVRGCA